MGRRSCAQFKTLLPTADEPDGVAARSGLLDPVARDGEKWGGCVDVRILTRDEVGTVVDWAAREGWNPGFHDAEAFFAADPDGFLGVDRRGALAGAISAIRYGDGYGFIGLFLVPKEFRRGLTGVRLGKAALDRLDGLCVGTDGVPAKQDQYARLASFRRAWRNVRYRGCVRAADLGLARRGAAHEGEGDDGRGDAGADLCPAAEVPFEALAEYDARHFGARRDAFLRLWLTMPGHRAWVCWEKPAGAAASDVASAAPGGSDVHAVGRVRGLGVIRKCGEGWKIGPLFAEEADTAETLFRRLVAGIGAGPVILDTPEANAQAVALAQSHGLTPVFETARMYRNGDPGLPVERIFGITTFELG